ncbi:MAG: hypothetical protein ACHP9Z_25630, partial [Streptosporangiales bacterium]
ARVSDRRRTPTGATMAVAVAVYLIIAFTWFILRSNPFTLFLESGTIGTLILLVVYVLATIGMVRLVFFGAPSGVRRWEIIIPVLGIIVLGYTLFRNVWPLPSGVAWWGPAVAIAWLLIGIIGALARPAATQRAGELLTSAEGLSGGGTPSAGPLPAEGTLRS